MKKFLILISISILTFSCKDVAAEPFGNTFYFKNPQPINDSELTSIPNKFLGLYMNSDSVYFNVNKNSILRETFTTNKIDNKILDSLRNDFEITNNKLILKSTKEVYVRRNLKDSIQLRHKNIDTFFIFSNTQKAKRINGYLILNEKDSTFWKIKIVSLQKNSLSVKYVYLDSDLKKIDSITKIKSKKIDSSLYIINPTRKEFRKILSLKNIGENQQFIKI